MLQKEPNLKISSFVKPLTLTTPANNHFLTSSIERQSKALLPLHMHISANSLGYLTAFVCAHFKKPWLALRSFNAKIIHELFKQKMQFAFLLKGNEANLQINRLQSGLLHKSSPAPHPPPRTRMNFVGLA